MYLITTAERGMEDISTHTTRLYSLTHSAQETGPSAEQIGQMTTDIYGSPRLLGAVLACQRPQKANDKCPRLPAFSPPNSHYLHYYTSHTPAHSRTERYNQLLTDCFPLPLTLNLSSSSISRQQSPPPIRSPQIHKPHQHHHASAHINHPARAVLCASADSLIQDQRDCTVERLNRPSSA
jgi:hypothetical protein